MCLNLKIYTLKMNANKDVTDNKTQTTYYSDTSSATGAKWLHFKVFRAILV